MTATIRSACAILCTLLMAMAFANTASAHGPTPQKVEEKMTIAAAPDKVWTVIKDFVNIASWHEGISKSEDASNDDTVARVITLANGGTLEESVDDVDEENKTLSYRLAKENVDAMPVSFYSASIRVTPAGDASEVEWIARLYRADTTNDPPEDKNDAAAVNAVTEHLKTGLTGLKTKLEAKG